MSPTTGLIIGALLLLANAFFVGAEFAVLSARRSAIEPLAEAGSRAAKISLTAIENVTDMLAMAQLGVTFCSTTLGLVAEPAIARLVEGPLVAVGLPAATSHGIAFIVALLLVIYLHVVVGEMVPKNLSITTPERAVQILAPPLVLLSMIFGPLVKGMNWLANHFLRLFGVEPRTEVAAAFTAEEVASIVERSQAEGVLEDDLGLLTGAIEFSEESAGDVMVPMADLHTLPLGCTPEQLERAVAQHGFSRYPVVNGDGEPIGYLHLKDIIGAVGATRSQPVPSWRLRTLASTTPDAEVEDTLGSMQRTGAHLARVAAEDGTTLGVVFLEDIIEELVGEVRDSMQRRA